MTGRGPLTGDIHLSSESRKSGLEHSSESPIGSPNDRNPIATFRRRRLPKRVRRRTSLEPYACDQSCRCRCDLNHL
jgi:hypothetical protein